MSYLNRKTEVLETQENILSLYGSVLVTIKTSKRKFAL